MANLLDRASVVLTATAYNNGEALCIKPDDGSGDFQFSRNSAATRVNAQGLVENVQILSSNLVQNGDFSEEGSEEVSNGSFSQDSAELVTNGSFDTDSNWNGVNTNGVTISNGSLNYSETSNGTNITQGSVVEIGKSYKVTLTISNYVKGAALVILGAGGTTQEISANGTFTIYGVASINTTLYIQARGASGTTLSIDNVSVREVGQDWTLGTGWSIGEDKAVLTNVGYNINCTQANVTTIGQYYKIEFTILDYISGQIRISLGGNATSLVSANGTYVFYLQATINNVLVLQPLDASGTNFSVTNISVKEVGQNWSLGDSWEIGSSKATRVTSVDWGLDQAISSAVNGRTYRVTTEITDYTSGILKLALGSGGSTVNTIGTALGVYVNDFVWDGTSGTIIRYQGSFVGSISNISVIEITDDTSLPRINYEGFSYQDALGSEEVVNGDFSSPTTIGWSDNYLCPFIVENNMLKATAQTTGSGMSYQINGLTIGSKYVISWDYINGSGALPKWRVTNSDQSALKTYSDNSNYYYFIPTATTANFSPLYQCGTAGTFYFDNVSVKEYLGQSVVPESGCGSWLFESQSTNLTPYSSDYTNWVGRISLSVNLNQGTSPSGETDANLISVGIDASATRHRLYNLNSFVLGNDYTFSVFAKKSDNNWFQLMFGQTAFGTQCYANFDLDNGVIGNVGTSTDANIVDYGNGWYRCLITCTATATSNTTFEILTTNNTNSGRYPSYQSTANTNVCFLWGAQLEEQSYATSYIPTENNPNGVTRNQDLCTNGGSLASINSTEGVLYAEISALANDSTTRRISLKGSSSGDRVNISFTSTTNRLQCFGFVGGVLQFNFTPTLTDVTQFNKIALKYKENDFALWVNGVEVLTDTSGITWSANTLNQLIFADQSTSEIFFGKTKAVAVWKEALSDQELTELTTI